MPKAKSIKKDKNNLSSNIQEFLFNSFFKWFLADAAYTLLPIAVIIFIQIGTKGKSDFLYLSPEWSFATIVSFGIAITGLIELKTEFQHDGSHRLYTGTRFYIILLIVAVITLSLVTLRDNGLIINEKFLWPIQITLLLLSLASLYMSHIAREKTSRERNTLPKTIGRRKYYAYMSDSLSRIENELRYLRFCLRRDKEIDFISSEPISKENMLVAETQRKNKLYSTLENIDQMYKDVMPLMQEFSAPKKQGKSTIHKS